MTPLHIEMLLHYYTRPGDYRDGDFSASAVSEYLAQLLENGLIGPLQDEGPEERTAYQITDKGKFLVNVICNMPMPVQSWAMPITRLSRKEVTE